MTWSRLVQKTSKSFAIKRCPLWVVGCLWPVKTLCEISLLWKAAWYWVAYHISIGEPNKVPPKHQLPNGNSIMGWPGQWICVNLPPQSIHDFVPQNHQGRSSYEKCVGQRLVIVYPMRLDSTVAVSTRKKSNLTLASQQTVGPSSVEIRPWTRSLFCIIYLTFKRTVQRFKWCPTRDWKNASPRWSIPIH